jgi:probable selenium-dependent hydroxylase accessory protein YqeC
MNFFHILFTHPEQAIGSRIGLIGGGGKTTLLFQLGTELASHHPKVLMTAITKAGPTSQFDIHLAESPKPEQINTLFKKTRPLYLLERQLGPEKYQGLRPERLQAALEQDTVCVFEADGARNRPVKIHNGTDPILPSWTTHAVIVVGARAVNAPLNGDTVHRWESFSRHWGIAPGAKLTPPLLAHILFHPEGYLSRIQHDVNLLYYINQADQRRHEARELAQALKQRTVNPVFVGSLHEGWWETVA